MKLEDGTLDDLTLKSDVAFASNTKRKLELQITILIIASQLLKIKLDVVLVIKKDIV